MVLWSENFERSSTKDLSKLFVLWQQCCQKVKVFEDLRETFCKNFPYDSFSYALSHVDTL